MRNCPSAHLTRRGHHVVVRVADYFVGLDLPEQALDLLLDLPLAIHAHRDHRRAEEQHPKGYRGDDAAVMRVVLGTVLVQETATWLGLRLVLPGPVHRLRRPISLFINKVNHLLTQMYSTYCCSFFFCNKFTDQVFALLLELPYRLHLEIAGKILYVKWFLL